MVLPLLVCCADVDSDARDPMLQRPPPAMEQDQPVAPMRIDTSEASPPIAPMASLSTAQEITRGDVSIQIGGGAAVLATNAQGEIFLADVSVSKLDADLRPVWQVHTGGRVFALVALADGGALAGGEYQDGCVVAAGWVCARGFITRLGPNGDKLWTLRFDHPRFASRVTGLAENDGVFYVAGQFDGELHLGREQVASAEGRVDFFVLALSPDATRAIWAHTLGSAVDDGDGPVLSANPVGGVIAAGHVQDAPAGFIRAYTATGETRFETVVRGRVSLFQLVVDGRGHIWASGGMRDTIELGDEQTPRRFVAQSEFDALVLELDPSGAVRSVLQLSSPTDGGVTSVALAPRPAGVWFINAYGYHGLYVDTKRVVTRIAVIDGRGSYRELDVFEMWCTGSRQAASGTIDGALLWTSHAARPTTFGLEEGTFPANNFLMRRTFSPAGDADDGS